MTMQDGAPTLSATAYEALTRRLVLLDIAPGEPINERALMDELGVGRTPVREALKRLESDHLVTTRPRRGTFASRVDITTLVEIAEVRQSLEPLAAALAARRADDADTERFRELQDALASLTDTISPRDVMNLDLQVHRAIYAAAHNGHLESILTRYGNLATRIWSVAAPQLTDVETHVLEHTALLDAVTSGEADRAQSLMIRHMDDFESRIRTVL